jgi:exonuclease SbcD
MAPKPLVFAHLADAHVGAWPRDPAVRSALRESVIRALRVARDRGADFLVISGDLFHTPVPDPAEVAPVAAELRTLVQSGVRIYAVFGSHDYVAHRTSWLDVLAETGIFAKVAPEAVRVEDQGWELPFLIDAPTGAVLAGVSGRSHGLDRKYYRSIDARRFQAQPGFKIFLFHSAVAEYLPEPLRDHIPGISREDLPAGADYYAGGHIHASYRGTGPGGGLLVNPGAVFGTSLPDIEGAARGRTHRGIVIVTVENGRPEAEPVDTVPKGVLDVFEVDVTGQRPDEARAALQAALRDHAAPGVLLFPRLRGTLDQATPSALGLPESHREAASLGAAGVHWDLRDLVRAPEAGPADEPSETDLERETIRDLLAASPDDLEELRGDRGSDRIRELIRELGTLPQEGESRHDYERVRVEAALRVLGLLRPPSTDAGG